VRNHSINQKQTNNSTYLKNTNNESFPSFLPSFLPQSAEIGQVKRRKPKARQQNGVLT